MPSANPAHRDEPDLATALAALRAQSDALSRIVRMECLRANVPVDIAHTLIERINHWWAFGEPKPAPPEIDPKARIRPWPVSEPLISDHIDAAIRDAVARDTELGRT